MKPLSIKEIEEQFIQQLKHNQNLRASAETKDIFKHQDYFQMINTVTTLIEQNGDFTLEEYRAVLYEKSSLQELAKELTYEKNETTGLVLAYGTESYVEYLVIGNKQEVDIKNENIVPCKREIYYDDLFDIASITKIFTSMLCSILHEKGYLNINYELGFYTNRFPHIKHLSLKQLLTFQAPLSTYKRIDNLNSYEEAIHVLNEIKISKIPDKFRPYTDMGAIILKFIVQEIMQQPFYDLISQYIILPAKMNNTFCAVPDKLKRKIVVAFHEYKVINDVLQPPISYQIGEVNDPKARVLKTDANDLQGHSGLFTNATDMAAFAQAIIRCALLSKEFTDLIGENQTGCKFDNDKYSQYLGYLSYTKHPVSAKSEIYHALSGNAFGIGGYTGTQFTVDCNNYIFLFMGGNRCHNRISMLDMSPKKRAKRCRMLGERLVYTTDDMLDLTVSHDFVYNRDKLRDAALTLSLQYRFLEELFGTVTTNKHKLSYIHRISSF